MFELKGNEYINQYMPFTTFERQLTVFEQLVDERSNVAGVF